MRRALDEELTTRHEELGELAVPWENKPVSQLFKFGANLEGGTCSRGSAASGRTIPGWAEGALSLQPG